MARSLEEMAEAVEQIREYAEKYDKPQRQEFFQDLFQALSVPLPEGNERAASIKTRYLLAVAALTAEVQPATRETYDSVLKELNETLSEGQLGRVWVTTEPDNRAVFVDRPSEVAVTESTTPAQRGYWLRDALPKRRKLSKPRQELIDRFRAELPETDRPFGPQGRRNG